MAKIGFRVMAEKPYTLNKGIKPPELHGAHSLGTPTQQHYPVALSPIILILAVNPKPEALFGFRVLGCHPPKIENQHGKEGGT